MPLTVSHGFSIVAKSQQESVSVTAVMFLSASTRIIFILGQGQRTRFIGQPAAEAGMGLWARSPSSILHLCQCQKRRCNNGLTRRLIRQPPQTVVGSGKAERTGLAMGCWISASSAMAKALKWPIELLGG